jgi:deazaflavin-dependent oxidoreductase (nitroreductase family)
MPLPKTLARVNRRITNPITRRFAGWLPPFAIVEHRGRRSGRQYRTPVFAFPATDGWVVALTYGAHTDWVENVLAAGGGRLKARRRWRDVTSPRLLRGAEWRRLVPLILHPVLALNDVDQFLRLTERGRRPRTEPSSAPATLRRPRPRRPS